MSTISNLFREIAVLSAISLCLVSFPSHVNGKPADDEERFVYSPVDGDRITAASADEWLSHGRTYSEQRFSPLNQINEATISGLKLAWSADLPTTRGIEATPIVVDGVMFTTGSWSIVYAYDAVSGQELWRFDPEVPRIEGAKTCCDVVNRGVAVWGDSLFFGTIDGRLIALDRRSGKQIWQTVTVDQTLNYTITGAPRVAEGKVLIGNGGADMGRVRAMSALTMLIPDLSYGDFIPFRVIPRRDIQTRPCVWRPRHGMVNGGN